MGVIFSLLASAGSIAFTAGVVWQQLQAVETRVDALEENDRINVERLARIETKIDLLIDDRKERNGK